MKLLGSGGVRVYLLLCKTVSNNEEMYCVSLLLMVYIMDSSIYFFIVLSVFSTSHETDACIVLYVISLKRLVD